MKRYAKYKDSGAEWLGEIPTHWVITKNRYGFQKINNGKNENDITNVLSLTTNGIKIKKNLDYGKSAETYIGHQLVNTGDIVFTPRDFDQTPILADVSKFQGCISNLYIVDKTKSHLNNHFIVYFWYGLKYSVNYFKNFSHGMRYSFNRFQFDEILLLIPPLEEQEQIVAYLDEKTSHIDNLLDISKRKIGLLKEQRSSIINQVITKGLNPNAKMKHSGVEWIGDIPEGWGVLPLKYLVKENSNSLSNSTDPDYKLKYIEISDINSNGTISNTTDYIFSNCPSRCRRILKKGDVAISTVRTYLKSIFIIENEVIDLVCSTGFSVLSPNKSVNSKHLFYMVRSEWFISSIISKSEGVSYPSIQSDKLMNTFVLNIPLIEQEQIVAYLDEKTSTIDKSISIEERRIRLLKEYRQSIISQVITGKIKVIADE
jgi:type I restriction enzyme, S subunit